MAYLPFISSDFNIGVYLAYFACYLSMVLASVAMTWPSPLTEWYSSKESEVPMTDHEVSWLVSIVPIVTAVTSIPCGILADRFGRKTILLVTGIAAAVSFLMILMTRTIWVLFLAQALGGIVLGGMTSVAPMYVSEIAPPNIRGAIVGQLNTMYFVGQLLVYVVGPMLTYTNYILSCLSLPILFFATLIFAPESPYYLMSRGRYEEAKECMAKLRGKDAISELEAAKKEAAEETSSEEQSIWKVLQTNSYMKHMICLQILSGVSMCNGLAALSIYVVEFVGGTWGSIVMGVTFVVSSFFAAFLADPIGRRPLLVSSLIGAALFTSVLTAYFIYHVKILLYIGLFGFCFITSVGINPFIMTLPSELFPTSLRAFANGLTQLTSGFFGFVCIKIFININETVGITYNFVLYTVISLFGCVAGYLLPETAKSAISAT